MQWTQFLTWGYNGRSVTHFPVSSAQDQDILEIYFQNKTAVHLAIVTVFTF